MGFVTPQDVMLVESPLHCPTLCMRRRESRGATVPVPVRAFISAPTPTLDGAGGKDNPGQIRQIQPDVGHSEILYQLLTEEEYISGQARKRESEFDKSWKTTRTEEEGDDFDKWAIHRSKNMSQSTLERPERDRVNRSMFGVGDWKSWIFYTV